jgi:hypothetical protein
VCPPPHGPLVSQQEGGAASPTSALSMFPSCPRVSLQQRSRRWGLGCFFGIEGTELRAQHEHLIMLLTACWDQPDTL